jgi:hypothetical protein
MKSPGRATMDSPAEQAAVGMQMASVGQVLQIGQAVVAEGATTLAGSPSAAPDPLPPGIEGRGELLNDPLNRNWVFYGKLLTQTPTVTQVYTRKAVLMSVSAVGENSFDAGTNVPIGSAIAKGDDLVVAVLARTRSSDGQGSDPSAPPIEPGAISGLRGGGYQAGAQLAAVSVARSVGDGPARQQRRGSRSTPASPSRRSRSAPCT